MQIQTKHHKPTAWNDLARRERIYVRVIYGFIPAVLALLLIATAVSGDIPRWLGATAGATGIATYFIAAAYLKRFRCPCCGEEFADPVSGPGRVCAHCHVGRDTDPNLISRHPAR